MRRPSPFPEKNRQRESAAASTKTASQPARFTRPVRGKPSAEYSGAVRPANGTVAAVTGKASFFTSGSNVALTAGSGRLDAAKLVAAHASYPLGSLVKVTNLANGKTVEVQIVGRFNDSRRSINLSEAAARELGFIKSGTADVRVELADGRARSPALK